MAQADAERMRDARAMFEQLRRALEEQVTARACRE